MDPSVSFLKQARFEPLEPSPELFGVVMRAVWRAQARRLRLRLGALVSAAGAFFGFAAWNAGRLADEFRASEAADLFRLFRSDPDVFFASAGGGALAFFEALPLAGLFAASVAAFLLVGIGALTRALWRRPSRGREGSFAPVS